MNKKAIVKKYLAESIDPAYRFAYTYVKNKEDAEDVVSESIIKALHAADSLKNPVRIKPWFYKIISNTALSLLEKNKKLVYSDSESFTSDEYSDDSFTVLSDADFDDIIKILDVKYRSIIVLRFMEDMKISDIAKILETSESTVKTRLYAALKILKADMEKKGFGEK